MSFRQINLHIIHGITQTKYPNPYPLFHNNLSNLFDSVDVPCPFPSVSIFTVWNEKVCHPSLLPSFIPSLGHHPWNLNKISVHIKIGKIKITSDWTPRSIRIHSFSLLCSGHQALFPGAWSLACFTAKLIDIQFVISDPTCTFSINCSANHTWCRQLPVPVSLKLSYSSRKPT